MTREGWEIYAPIIYTCSVVALLWSVGIIPQPFLAHDDLDWLLPHSYPTSFESPYAKTLSEGRWINYVWYFFSYRLSPIQSFAIYLPVFCYYFYVNSEFFKKRSPVSAFLIFISPSSATLIIYPSTLFLGFFLISLITYFSKKAHNDKSIFMYAILAFYVGYMSYPSFSAFLLIILLATRVDSNIQAFKLIGSYVGSIFLCVFSIFTLNYLSHGVFGIEPASWRAATPLSDGGDIWVNVAKVGESLKQLVAVFWFPALVSVLGYGICVVLDLHRRSCAFVLAGAVFLLVFEGAIAISNGVPYYGRSALWLWAVISVPPLLLLADARRSWVGGLLASALIVWSAVYWAQHFDRYKDVYPQFDHIARDFSIWAAQQNGEFDRVEIYGDGRENSQLRSMNTNRMIRNYLYKAYGINSTACRPEICQKVGQRLSQMPATYLLIDRTAVIVLSNKPTNDY